MGHQSIYNVGRLIFNTLNLLSVRPAARFSSMVHLVKNYSDYRGRAKRQRSDRTENSQQGRLKKILQNIGK